MTAPNLTALRGLDHAPSGDLSTAEAVRAEAGLDRILAGEDLRPTSAGAVADLAAASRRRTVRRVALPASVAATAAVAVAFSLTGPAPRAYAAWTPEPSPLAAADLAVLDAACQARVGSRGDVSVGDVVLAERRGPWAAVMYLGEHTGDGQPMESSCVAYLPPGAPTAEDVFAGSASTALPARSARAITEGSIAQSGGAGPFPWSRERPLLSLTNGTAGADVAAVTLRLADGTAVETTLEDGVYVVWWPGEAFDPATVGGPSGEGGPEPSFTYEVTYTDGTTAVDVAPEMPE